MTASLTIAPAGIVEQNSSPTEEENSQHCVAHTEIDIGDFSRSRDPSGGGASPYVVSPYVLVRHHHGNDTKSKSVVPSNVRLMFTL